MAVEYGVGITNRFSFLPEESEDEVIEETKTENRKPQQLPASKSKKEEISKDSKNQPKRGTKGQSKDVRGEIRQNKNSMNMNVINEKMNSMAVSAEKAGTRDGTGMGRNYNRQGPGQQTVQRTNRDGRGDASGNQQRGNPRRRPMERSDEGEQGKERQQADNRNRDEVNTETKDNVNENDADANTDGVDNASKENENEDKVSEAAEKTITLGEWKASQTPREMPVFNIRRPGEGEDFGRLGKLILKKKEDEIAQDAEDDYETDEAFYPQRAGKFKQISDVGFTTGYQKRRGSGGRFSNGRGRTGGGEAKETSSDENVVTEKLRGRTRYESRRDSRRPAAVPRIDDTAAFPSLA